MFRPMRRIRQQLPEAEVKQILTDATAGVLAVAGDDGYPYAVPVSFVYADGRIYLHCARTGHKIDAIEREPKVSFCVTAQDSIVPDEYTTYFKSVIAFGRARILKDPEQMRAAIEVLAKKYAPAHDAVRHNAEIDKSFAALCMIEIEIEHVTGKEAIELTRRRG